MGLSQHSTVSLEDVAAAAPECPRWFQLYILKNRALTVDILRRYGIFCRFFFILSPYTGQDRTAHLTRKQKSYHRLGLSSWERVSSTLTSV